MNQAMPGADSDRDRGTAGHSRLSGRLSGNGGRSEHGFKEFKGTQ